MDVIQEELEEKLHDHFPSAEVRIQRKGRVWIQVEPEAFVPLCTWLKETGFGHLSAISVTDWPERKVFEETCHLWSQESRIVATVKITVDRDKPLAPSLFPLWHENAQVHERELHELFGIVFDGNPDLSPLFLEEWSGPAPFLKDFDWQEYVRENYYSEDNAREVAYFEGR